MILLVSKLIDLKRRISLVCGIKSIIKLPYGLDVASCSTSLKKSILPGYKCNI